ncbi:MAG: RNA ligase family protein [Bacillota bacterium]
MESTFRFPDKPTTSSEGVLTTLRDGDWLAQAKYDGWRALVEWDGTRALLTSRHQEIIPASQTLLAEIAEALAPLPPCLLDGEWMGRRDGQPESLWLFDLLAIEGTWLGNVGAAERFARFCRVPWPKIPDPGPRVKLVECVTSGYIEFFQYSKRLPGCEGIVLKHKDSKFIGSVRKCVDNPLWLKAKWRDGADGQVLVA